MFLHHSAHIWFSLSTIIIHHLDGLFGRNLMTSSQLAQLIEPCTSITEVIGLNPIQAWFFSGLISTTSSVVFIAGRTFHIHFFTALQIYDFHISTITINQTFLLRSLYSCNSSGSLIFCLGGWKEISISKMNYFNNHLKSADIVASRINTR